MVVSFLVFVRNIDTDDISILLDLVFLQTTNIR